MFHSLSSQYVCMNEWLVCNSFLSLERTIGTNRSRNFEAVFWLLHTKDIPPIWKEGRLSEITWIFLSFRNWSIAWKHAGGFVIFRLKRGTQWAFAKPFWLGLELPRNESEKSESVFSSYPGILVLSESRCWLQMIYYREGSHYHLREIKLVYVHSLSLPWANPNGDYTTVYTQKNKQHCQKGHPFPSLIAVSLWAFTKVGWRKSLFIASLFLSTGDPFSVLPKRPVRIEEG